MPLLGMGQNKRETFHHGNLRQALLDAARTLLDEGGPDHVTIRATARKVGVSHAAPINHFADRQALLTRLASDLFSELWTSIEARLPDKSLTPEDRIASFAHGLIDYGLANKNRYRLLWRRDLLDQDDETLNERMDAIYDRLIEEAGALSGPKQFDPDTLAIGLWSMAHGYVSMRNDGNFEPGQDQINRQCRQDAMISAYLSSFSDA